MSDRERRVLQKSNQALKVIKVFSERDLFFQFICTNVVFVTSRAPGKARDS